MSVVYSHSIAASPLLLDIMFFIYVMNYNINNSDVFLSGCTGDLSAQLPVTLVWNDT